MAESTSAFADLLGRGVKLHYRDWGGDGPPIVLLHGLASSARIWDMVAPLLTPEARIIAADQRGHGLSSKPEDGYGFGEVTADLAVLIELLDLARPIVVGHSWGGGVAAQFAADYPGVVRGLVLVDGGFAPMASETTWEKAEEMMRPPEIDGLEVESFVGFMKTWPDIKDLWSEQLKEMMLSIFDVREGKIYRRLPIPTHLKIARAIWEQRQDSLWDRITVPALLIPAMRQPTNEREEGWYNAKLRGIAEAQAKMADVRVIRMEDTIHDIPIQRPTELGAAIGEFARSLLA